mgnify:CR=1 FL=1
MHTTTLRRRLDVSADRVWAAFDDFGGIHKFHPMIESSPLTSGQAHGLGCERACHLYGGGVLKERVTHYEPGRRMTVQITDAGPFPLRHAVADIAVVAEGPRASSVTFTMAFEPKFGAMGWVMAKVVMIRQFRGLLEQILDGLATHLDTGQRIGPRGVPVPVEIA